MTLPQTKYSLLLVVTHEREVGKQPEDLKNTQNKPDLAHVVVGESLQDQNAAKKKAVFRNAAVFFNNKSKATQESANIIMKEGERQYDNNFRKASEFVC